MGRNRTPWEPRFLAKVVQVGNCMMWTGAKSSNGYGYFRGPYGLELAHKTMWRKTRLRTPGRLRNTCGNRACVNPEHWR